MTTVTDLRVRLQKIDISFQAGEAINDTKETVIDKQRDQLLHGLRADGTLIGKYRNKVYAAKKFAQNPLAGFGNMDWKLTGSLHRELFVDVRNDLYVIDSADEKTGGLSQQFKDPFGLTKESQQSYIDEKLRSVFIERVKKESGL